MSVHRRQAHLDAPIQIIWELVANPNRHPEWIPRVIEVECWTEQTLEALADAAARESARI